MARVVDDRRAIEKLGNPLLRAYATSKLGLLADAEERFGDALRLHIEARDLFASANVGSDSAHELALWLALLDADFEAGEDRELAKELRQLANRLTRAAG